MADCCTEETSVSKIKLDDEGSERVIVVLNKDRTRHKKIRVDGCLIKQKTAADWILTKPQVGHLVVELKGTDVDHAVLQILATAKVAAARAERDEKLGGLIACARYPRVDTKIQRGKQKFSDQFGGPLRVVTKDEEFSFELLVGAEEPKRR
ncbi:hypothetical protein [Robbsia andropogonis]|uniref:hypothetical protein n=1 Tax=Robbsia andropogonis TaxID=28092 RepID=UPI00209F28D6|nr:hypothetical protein [Robbsia andropogonis]MCP1116925.1 hypothetical protein [Robbsia andropogonis]MCP1126396.1 hypothetical protein [Robbsia andropogonis]